MKPSPLGEQELEVLRFVTDRAPVTVREVAEEWGKPRNLARTTILTVMERLREKGYLLRTKNAGETVYQYAPAVEKAQLMRSLVEDFVEKTLGGSLSPFVAYLADTKGLSESETDDLMRLVREMEREQP